MQQDSLSSQQSQQSPRRSKEVRSKQNGKDKAVSPLAKQKAMPKVSEREEFNELTVKNVEQEYLRGQIIFNHRIHQIVEFEKRDAEGLRSKEQEHLVQLEDCREWEEQVFQKAIDEDEERHEAFKALIEQENADLEQDILKMQQEIESVQLQRDEQRSNYQEQIAEKEQSNKELEELNESLRFENEETEVKVRIGEIKNELLEMIKQNQEAYEEKENLQSDLETAAKYIEELESKIYKSNGTSLELLKNLRDCEEEIESLKFYICDLKGRIAVYIPVKGDSTDKKLAEYINNYPERSKLKIMFMRESSGVYQFGTKRVNVKVAKDKIEIRVGGGYLSIDEFLDQYTPAELEKLERKDPMRRMNERIAVQKIAASSKAIRESSPIRGTSPGLRKSPTRPSSRPSTSGTGRSSVGRAGGAKKVKV